MENNIIFVSFYSFLEATKISTSNIYRLVLEPDENDDSIRLDFRMLAEQAIPLELRQWVYYFRFLYVNFRKKITIIDNM